MTPTLKVVTQITQRLRVPDDDYTVLIDIDYEQRLSKAKPEKREEVKRYETLQEVFDEMNRQEYNAHRRFNRKRGEMKIPFRKMDTDTMFYQ